MSDRQEYKRQPFVRQPYVRPTFTSATSGTYFPYKSTDNATVDKLFLIVQDGDYNKIREFVNDNGITLNIRNKNGESVLHKIIPREELSKKDRYELVRFFLDNGAPINALNRSNVSALHLASKYSLADVVELLLSKGADVKAVDNQNMNAVHYLVQSVSTPCKKVKRVEALVPKPNTINANTTASQRQELKALMALIVDILYTSNFNVYIKHIKNSIQILQDVNPQYFIDMNKKYGDEILATVANQSKTVDSKQRDIESKTVNLIGDVRSKIKDSLQTTLKPLTIAPDETDPAKLEDVNPPQVLSKMKLKFTTASSDSVNSIEKDMLSVRQSLTIMTENIMKIYISLTQILFHNRNLEANNFRPDVEPEIVEWDELRDLYLYNTQTTKPFRFPDLNFTGEIPVDRLVFQSINDIEPTIRGTMEQINRWRNERLKPIGSILTVDRLSDNSRPVTGPDVEARIAGREPISLLGIIGPGSNYPVAGNRFLKPANNGAETPKIYIDQPIYYISKLQFSIRQIGLNYSILIANIKALDRQLKSSYHYEVYHRLITNIIYSIFNIFQNIVFATQDKNMILETTREIEQKFEEIKKANIGHPYYFSVENATSYTSVITVLTTKIFDQFDSIYSKLSEIMNKLNNVIGLVNDISAINYMTSFFNNFTDNVTNPINDIYDRLLLPIEKPNLSFEDYYELYGQFDPTDEASLDLTRKQLYEKYGPKITKYNFATYLSGTVADTDLVGTVGNIFRSDIPGADAALIRVPIRASADKPPRIGYLLYTDPRPPNAPPYLPHWKSDKTGLEHDLENGNPLLPLDTLTKTPITVELPGPDNLGTFGYKYTVATKTKQEPVYPSIGQNLDLHFNMIKYMLVKNVVEFIKTRDATLVSQKELIDQAQRAYNDLKNNLKTVYGVDNVDSVVNTVVGRLVDELIINLVNQYSQQVANRYVKNSLSAGNSNKDLADALNSINSRNIEYIFSTDTGFELHLNELFDELINEFMTKQVPVEDQDSYNSLKYSSVLVEDQVEQPDQFPIYNTNYSSTTGITELRCYKIDPTIIRILKEYHADLNSKDANQSSPIFSAIGMLHTDLIRELLANGALVSLPSVKNRQGLTPYQYSLDMYGNTQTSNKSITSVLENLTAPFYKDVVDTITSKPEYKNNIIKYLNTVFQQIIIMYNNTFYFYATAYFGGWSFDKQKKLIDLFIKYGILNANLADDKILPILRFDPQIVEKNSNLHVLTRASQQKTIMQATENTTVFDAQHRISNIDKEIAQLSAHSSDKFIKSYIDELGKKKQYYQDIINQKDQNGQTQQEMLASNINSKSSAVAKEISKRRDDFITNKNYLNTQDVASIYQNIFDYIVNNNDLLAGVVETGQEDVRLYNEMWLDLIKQDTKLHHPSNIHLMCLLLKSKLIQNLKGSTTNNNTSALQDIKVLKSIYGDVFVKLVRDYVELPQEYKKVNYILTDIVNIIIHTVKYTLCNSLYLATIKVLVKYIKTINPKELNGKVLTVYEQNKTDYDNFIKQVINGVVDFNYGTKNQPDPKLEKYIINILPQKLVKHVLKIYSGDEDEDRTITNVDDLLEPINIILKKNTVLSIPDDSSVLKNLTDNIYPYFRDLFVHVITSMKILLDNYNNYILNENRYLNILEDIVQKAIQEN